MYTKNKMTQAADRVTLAVVGGGAAGMAAAAFAAARGVSVVCFEKNEKPGRKLAITGKGRCNVTNNCAPTEVCAAFIRGGQFLRSAVSRFSPADTIAYFESLGCPLKTERGNRVFPVSDRAFDIVDALRRAMRQGNVELRHACVRGLLLRTDETGLRCTGISTDRGDFAFDAVLLATGGLSYPTTGSDGDGYRFAESAGHTVVPPQPSLIPIETVEHDCAEMMGLSLKNTGLRLTRGDSKKAVYEDLGEMLFTHFGVSGPMILSASAHIDPTCVKDYVIHLDLKPALDADTLDKRLLRDFESTNNRDFQNALGALLPQKLAAPVIRRCGIDPHQKVYAITREQRCALRTVLKDFTLHPSALRPIAEAIVTRGGVKTAEINPKTMESRCATGLYFAGEIMDIDACTGGFNLQGAFSTAAAAAEAISAISADTTKGFTDL